MAPLPQNNTARYILRYTNGADLHDISIRFDDAAVSPGDAAAMLGTFLSQLGNVLPAGFGYISARVQPRGTTFTLPIGVPLIAPVTTAPALSGTERAAQLVFSGRTLQGRSIWITVIGITNTPPTDWAFDRGDNNEIDDALDFLQGNGGTPLLAGTFIGIDGQVVSWYDRATYQYNDYWIRQIRP